MPKRFASVEEVIAKATRALKEASKNDFLTNIGKSVLLLKKTTLQKIL